MKNSNKKAADETRSRILRTTVDVLAESGLTDWTVEDVATRAGCAKGLVNYHFASKVTLLNLAAAQARADRQTARILALKRTGTEAIDRLWDTLLADARSGAFRLWLSLLAYPKTVESATVTPAERHLLASTAAQALNLNRSHTALAFLPAALDGLELLLLQGVPEADVREQFDRFWLDLLTTAGAG